MPHVLESFKCPSQSLINDPIHSPLPSFVSATEKCLPRATLHFLLLFCVFFKRKKKLAAGRRDLGQRQPRSPRFEKADLFKPFRLQCPRVIYFLKMHALGKSRSGEYLKPEAFTT